MKLTLTKQRDPSNREALIVLIKKPVYMCRSIAIGETIEVDDEMGFTILGDERYRGLFKSDSKETVTTTKTPAKVVAKTPKTNTKVMKPKTDDDDKPAVTRATPPKKKYANKNVIVDNEEAAE